jgi:predicted HAD superfamily Cof-like phosphohydrolase
MKPADMVREFHEFFNLPIREELSLPVDKERVLRYRLQKEETVELESATYAGDVIEVADALADIVYVAYGTALVYGIDLDAVLEEVHKSNMTKLDENGEPIYREDGKVAKSPQFRPPDIASVLNGDS